MTTATAQTATGAQALVSLKQLAATASSKESKPVMTAMRAMETVAQALVVLKGVAMAFVKLHWEKNATMVTTRAAMVVVHNVRQKFGVATTSSINQVNSVTTEEMFRATAAVQHVELKSAEMASHSLHWANNATTATTPRPTAVATIAR